MFPYWLVATVVAAMVLPMLVLGIIALLRANAEDIPAVCEKISDWFAALRPWSRR